MPRSDKSDIFISYRRLNIDFAKKLVEALRARGFETWFDLEDIAPASPSYMADIHKGIEGANIFISILSPDYVKSEICIAELRHAAENGKRIIPIVYEKDFDTSDLPEQANSANWIFFCEHLGDNNDFDTAFSKLMEGIFLNRDYIIQHTRYLERAIAWDTGERNDDALLAGNEIVKAEVWFDTETQVDAGPTPLQALYIFSSRQYENKKISRNRRNLGFLFLAGLVAIVFLLISFTNTIDFSGGENLQAIIEANLQASIFYVIDTDALSALNQAIDSNDTDTIDELLPIVEANLLTIEDLYPLTTTYFMDIEDQQLLAWYEIPVNQDFTRTEFVYEVHSEFEKDENINRWIVGSADLGDSDGNYAGTIVMEFRDPLADVAGSITTAIGLAGIAFIILALGIAFLFIRSTTSSWITAHNSPIAKLAKQLESAKAS